MTVIFPISSSLFWLTSVALGVCGHTDETRIREPFADLHGFCSDCNPFLDWSPDPLISYTWNETFDDFGVPQIYRIRPQIFQVSPIGAATFDGLHAIAVHEPCVIRVDWQVERAAWMEIVSADKNLNISASLSEFNYPYPGKTRQLKRYGETHRLETNNELYEGIRYTWLYFDKPANISEITLLAKVKPVKYHGAFLSSDVELTRSWYTGAYAVRLNMEESEFNSVLVERGDRVAIQGDGHPTMSAALVAFAPYKLIEYVLNSTDSGTHNVVDDNIMAYPLYWCLSVIDWYMASGNLQGFKERIPSLMKLVDKRLSDFLDPDLDLNWMGWDDALGNGWCFHSTGDDCGTEAKLTFAGLVIRVCRDLARALYLAGSHGLAGKYQRSANRCTTTFRALKEWPSELGVHAVANAINAGVATAGEVYRLLDNILNDPVTICSESQFNQYFILQGLSNAADTERALASIKMCWATLFRVSNGCFWENFSPDWIYILNPGDVAPGLQSACHPWSSGVTSWQTHVLAGLEALLPGYKEYVASPYVSRRYPSVSATVPTPEGPISINATVTDFKSTARMTISLRTPVPGFVGIRNKLIADSFTKRSCSHSIDTLLVDGKERTTFSIPEVNASDLGHGVYSALLRHYLPVRGGELRFVRLERGGNYIIQTLYDCGDNELRAAAHTTPISRQKAHKSVPDYSVPPFGPITYPSDSTYDRNSSGDGLRIHGVDGYLLLGYDNGKDRKKLPSFIQSVSIMLHGYPGRKVIDAREFVGFSVNDTTYLPDPRGNATQRALGMVGHDIPSVGQFSNVNVEVVFNGAPNKTYCVSLYSVAKAPTDRHSIRSMDLKTKQVIAPSALIDSYQSGIWWTLKCNRSVRLRLQTTIGLHLSAVAFRLNPETEQEQVSIL